MDKNTWIGLSISALCLLFVFITQAPEIKTPDALLQETMDIHDTAMADLALMNRLGRQLKKELIELDSLAPRADSIQSLLLQIKQAETDMYGWMREYKAPEEPLDEAAKAYVKDQKMKISKNFSDIQAALLAAQKMSR